MLETTMIATAEHALKLHRELRCDPARARQAILAPRSATPDGAPPGVRPDRSPAVPTRLLLRLRPGTP